MFRSVKLEEEKEGKTRKKTEREQLRDVGRFADKKWTNNKDKKENKGPEKGGDANGEDI